jgi:hypothetical protein
MNKRMKERRRQNFLCQNVPSYLGSFSKEGVPVMSESSTLDHSARHEPAIPALQVLES